MKKVKETPTIFIIILLITLGTVTYLHDPILHSLIAYLSGWEVTGYINTLTTGSTDAIALKDDISPESKWLFYMFPSLFIYGLTTLIVLKYPYKPVLVFSTVPLFLNLPSFDPSNKGSDSYNALQALTSAGYSEPSYYIFHMLIFFTAIIILGTFLYISVENNIKDAKNRIRRLRI